MKAKEFIEKISLTKTFKDWKKKTKEQQVSYLANIFYMRSSENDIIQAGYYNKKTDKMTSISLKPDGKCEIVEENEIMKKPDTKVHELDMSSVEFDLDTIQPIVKKHLLEKYPNEKFLKEIMILQTLEFEGTLRPLWNLTFVSNTMNVVNIKIDAKDGKILKSKKHSIMEFRGE